jgi:hypothetical protein
MCSSWTSSVCDELDQDTHQSLGSGHPLDQDGHQSLQSPGIDKPIFQKRTPFLN